MSLFPKKVEYPFKSDALQIILQRKMPFQFNFSLMSQRELGLVKMPKSAVKRT